MKKSIKIIYAVLCVVLASSAFSPRAEALKDSFDILNFKPAISNNTDYFGVYSSQMVAKHGWNAGFYVDYAKNPLEIGQPLGSRSLGVVDHMITGNFYGTYGILDWLSVGLNIPIVFWEDFIDNIPQLPFGVGSGISDAKTNLGDIRLEMKFRILDNSEEKLIGLSLVPFVTMPSGNPFVFTGNGGVTGGLKVVLDFNIHDRVKLALNVGYLARPDVTVLNVQMDDQLLLGLGLSIKIIERLMFIAEAENTAVIKNIYEHEVETPLEARGGFRVKLTDNLNLNVGGGAGLTIGVGSPDFRAFLGLNYNWAPPPCAACEKPMVEAKEIMIDQVIHFEFDKANIRPQSYPILNDVAAIIKSNEGSIGKVVLEGNTDAVGSDAYNQALSDRRAASVKSYLVKEGVPASMLETVGYGESRPVATNDTAAGRALNRRTQFKVVPK